MPEPGRRIVARELARNGRALPWVDARAFALRAMEMARSDLEGAHRLSGLVFFDRGLFDAAVALEHAGGPTAHETLGKKLHYAMPVFIVPPWREIFENDAERKHNFDSAVQEYNRLDRSLDALGYQKISLPKVSVDERVEIILRECGWS